MKIWKVVPGYRGVEVSNLGEVRYRGVIKPLCATGKNASRGGGYLACRINNKLVKAHILVATAFIPNPLGLPQVNHKDLDTFNNQVRNLEWITNSGNQLHSYANGRVPVMGEQVGTSKFKASLICECRKLSRNGIPLRKIARITGISKTHVRRIVRGESWKHLLKNS